MDLGQWTPVAVSADAGAASIDWGDLRKVRFAEPFFHQTIERWAGDNPPPLVRTGLSALAPLDSAPSLDPAALIFHVSRCGSTLLSRLLGAVPGTLVVSEPAPLNALLLADPAALDGHPAVEALRLMVRALGRQRFGDERSYVLKLSSWNVTHQALFRRAFPEAAVVWLMRAPEDVVGSLIADPPGWLGLRHDPAAARAAFGIGEPASDIATFCVQIVTALLEAASGIDGSVLFLDYADLPEAAWERAAPFIGLGLRPDDVEHMRDLARFEAKEPALRPFAAPPAGRPPLPQAVRALVDERAAPLYAALRGRRCRARPRD